MRETVLNSQFIYAFLLAFSCLVFGFVVRRKDIVKDEGKRVLKTVIWDFALPAMAFTAFMQDFSVDDLRSGGAVTIATSVFYLFLIITCKLLFRRAGKDRATVIALFVTLGQLTLFTMPVISALGYSRAMFYCSMMTLPFRIFLYTVACPMILSEKGKRGNIKKVLLSPVMIAMILGFVFWLTQNAVVVNEVRILRIDESLPYVHSVMKSLSNTVCPLAMIMIGMILGESDIKATVKDKTAWLAALIRTAVIPGIVLLVSRFLPSLFDADAVIALTLGFAAPASATLCAFCVTAKKEEILSSRIVALSVITAMFFMPLFLLLVL